MIETLTEDNKTPWTYTKVAKEIGNNQFTQQRPDESEWRRAQDPLLEEQPTWRRRTGKRAAPGAAEQDHEMEEPGPVEPPVPQRPRTTASNVEGDIGACWWTSIDDEHWGTATEWWKDRDAAVEVQVEMPSSNRAWKRAMSGMSSYFVGAMKKRAVEICERKLSAEERREFDAAKMIEVKNEEFSCS